LETRRRLEQILNLVSGVPAPETLRTIRAIMALERIGSPEAKSVLETLAKGAPERGRRRKHGLRWSGWRRGSDGAVMGAAVSTTRKRV